ncbi:MAG: DUF3310 domain-containing protein [Sarcina sp.]
MKQEYDVVNKSSHYNQGNIEVIEYLEDQLGEKFAGFCIGNVIKYVSRYEHKNGLEDLKKAAYYLDRLIKRMESKHE